MTKIKQIENTETYLAVCTTNNQLLKLRVKKWKSDKKFFVVCTKNDISNLEKDESFWRDFQTVFNNLQEEDVIEFSHNISIVKVEAIKKNSEYDKK